MPGHKIMQSAGLLGRGIFRESYECSVTGTNTGMNSGEVKCKRKLSSMLWRYGEVTYGILHWLLYTRRKSWYGVVMKLEWSYNRSGRGGEEKSFRLCWESKPSSYVCQFIAWSLCWLSCHQMGTCFPGNKVDGLWSWSFTLFFCAQVILYGALPPRCLYSLIIVQTLPYLSYSYVPEGSARLGTEYTCGQLYRYVQGVPVEI
jgi:hypothetical protein